MIAYIVCRVYGYTASLVKKYLGDYNIAVCIVKPIKIICTFKVYNLWFSLKTDTLQIYVNIALTSTKLITLAIFSPRPQEYGEPKQSHKLAEHISGP